MVITLPPIFGFPNSGFLLDIDSVVKFTLGNYENILNGYQVYILCTKYKSKNQQGANFWDTLHDVLYNKHDTNKSDNTF